MDLWDFKTMAMDFKIVVDFETILELLLRTSKLMPWISMDITRTFAKLRTNVQWTLFKCEDLFLRLRTFIDY